MQLTHPSRWNIFVNSEVAPGFVTNPLAFAGSTATKITQSRKTAGSFALDSEIPSKPLSETRAA
jgi:hypothetical protein